MRLLYNSRRSADGDVTRRGFKVEGSSPEVLLGVKMGTCPKCGARIKNKSSSRGVRWCRRHGVIEKAVTTKRLPDETLKHLDLIDAIHASSGMGHTLPE